MSRTKSEKPPILLMIGETTFVCRGLPCVLPYDGVKLSAVQLGRLREAAKCVLASNVAKAGNLIGSVELDLGVTMEMVAAATVGEQFTNGPMPTLGDRRRAMLSKGKTELPSHERGLAPDIVERWEAAKARLTSPHAKPNAKEYAAKSMHSIESFPKVEREREWQSRSRVETELLATLRGEEFVPEGAAIKITTHDGLDAMFEARKPKKGQPPPKNPMTKRQYDAGLSLRDLWDRAHLSEGLGSQMGRIGQSGGSGRDVGLAKAIRIKEAVKALADLDKIWAAVKADQLGSAVEMLLKEVAIKGHSLRNLTTSSRDRERLGDVLKRGLDVVANILGTKDRPAISVSTFETNGQFCAYDEEAERLRQEEQGGSKSAA